MELYYDNVNNSFCLNKAQSCECVFVSYEKHERIGWEEGDNPVIKKGPFEITIRTNFYPKAPKREELVINIAVNGKLLLPLSMACRKADVLYYFRKHDIAFLQYGAGKNGGRNPATIVHREENISWERALTEICEICNNYEKWLVEEVNGLLAKLLKYNKTKFSDIATLLELVRIYDDIAPGIIPIYKDFVDKYCVDAMQDLLDYVKNNSSKDRQMTSIDRILKRRNGNVLWRYIKDFYL